MFTHFFHQYKLNFAVSFFSVLLLISCYSKIGLLHNFAETIIDELPSNASPFFAAPLHKLHDIVEPFQFWFGLMIIAIEAVIAIAAPLGWLKKGRFAAAVLFFFCVSYVECCGGVFFGPATDPGAGAFVLSYLVFYWIVDPPSVFLWRKSKGA